MTEFSAIRRKVEQQVVQQAMDDPRFRARLLASPKATIVAEFQKYIDGYEFPDDADVQVIQEKVGTFVVVLPFQRSEHDELSLEELEMAAGGTRLVIGKPED